VTRDFAVSKEFNYIQLKQSESKLDEVQVIAYGKTSRRLSTGNISTVNHEDIEKAPVSNPLLALAGRVPGIFIEQSSGVSGSGVKIRIQGMNSISKGNDPLYVIDGIPFTSQLLPSLSDIQGSSGGDGLNVAGNPLNFINPADIESISILKDADATSIYGSRAANGAILIATKLGKTGKTNIDVNIQSGLGKVPRHLHLLNTEQYISMRNEAITQDGLDLNLPPYNSETFRFNNFRDIFIYDSNKYTDWQKELIGGTANYNDYRFSISGGSESTGMLLGVNYKTESSVFPGPLKNQKSSVFFNLNHQAFKNKLTLNLTASYQYDGNRLQSTDLTNLAITLPPNSPSLTKDDGSLNWEQYKLSSGVIRSAWTNPLAYQLSKFQLKTNNLIANGILSYEIFKGLTFKNSFGYTRLTSDQIKTQPIAASRPEIRQNIKGSANFGNGSIDSWTIEPQINHELKLGTGTLGTLLGFTFYQMVRLNTIFNGKDYINDLNIEDIRSAGSVSIDPNEGYGSLNSRYKYNALFGRVNYNIDNKYLINLTFRRDGSSRFGTENRFQNFGSIAAAWIFSDESWMKSLQRIINYSKIRLSYGTTGNDQINDYTYLSLFNTVAGDRPYQGSNGLEPAGLSNPYLQWEQTSKIQFGLDLGFFDNRILMNGTYYYNQSSNQLLNFVLPSTAGFEGILLNFPALIKNKGFEIQLSTENLKKGDLKWTSSFNITIQRNILSKFPDLSTSSYKDLLVLNRSINIQKMYKSMGVNSQTGLYSFYDINGRPTQEPSDIDRTYLFEPNPDFFGGLANNITWKGLELSFLFQFVKQRGFGYRTGYYPGRSFTNQPSSVLNRWSSPGDNTDIERYSTGLIGDAGSSFFNVGGSDAAIEDASYIRLKNASLSYHLPKKWVSKIRLQNVRVYTHGQNLLTFTKFSGLDPENRSTTSLPPLRLLTFGTQITF